MKICVYGAGSIGGSLAARLAHVGADISVIVRGEHFAATKRKGLALFVAPSQIARALDFPTPIPDLMTAFVGLRLRAASRYERCTETLS
jgi:ketopantoate reductase